MEEGTKVEKVSVQAIKKGARTQTTRGRSTERSNRDAMARVNGVKPR
jgi:hypothetical protein